ncbi:hypothetical protein [Pelagibaculum spongiae]|uniref:Calcineurin-like phosphoesterase domain-containing protein n=1 Tax=Pelagibaculum spongiae TaxID=2080658 RepID=A0A2V1GUJ6_9GAMM|nr:hypothetical protein [Pelagibaculum spongiae]PVZ66347.1 hypothetical protein DC094_16755 [Pelagibaculum spongiae]
MSITLRSGLSLASIAVSLILAGCDNGPQSTTSPSQQPETLDKTSSVSTLHKRETTAENILSQPLITNGNPSKSQVEFFTLIETDAGAKGTGITAYNELALEGALGDNRVASTGDALIRRNDLRSPIYAESAQRNSVAFMLHMSDVQVVDEESPALTPTNDFGLDGEIFQGSYRPHSPYLPHMANELVKAANQVAANTRDFDIAIHTGDAIENAQANELTMFLTLLNGGNVNPDSDSSNGAVDVDANSANAPFPAEGFRLQHSGDIPAGTLPAPWLSVIGNHDILQQGNFPLGLVAFFNNDVVFQSLQPSFASIGITIPPLPMSLVSAGTIAVGGTPVAQQIPYRAALTSAETYTNPDDLDLAGFQSWTKLMTKFGTFVGTADAAVEGENTFNFDYDMRTEDLTRLPLNKQTFVKGHRDAGMLVGQELGLSGDALTASADRFGFKAKNLAEQHGNYTYDFADGKAPVRVIALDMSNAYGGDEGVLAQAQQPFDVAALQTSDAATSVQLSTAESGLLLNGTIPLFGVVTAQGAAITENIGDADSRAFLTRELARAEADRKLVVVTSHHASESLQVLNLMRARLEGVLCEQLRTSIAGVTAVAAEAVDCSPASGAIYQTALGSVLDKNAANATAKNLFAKLVGGAISQPITQFDQLSQPVISGVAATPDGARLISTFNLLFNLRQILPNPINPMNGDTFRRTLAGYDNVVLHLAGHSHRNEILAICSNGIASHANGDVSDPKLNNLKSPGNNSCADNQKQFGQGYYEIRTAANADWPLEWRNVEMVDNNNGTLSIYTPVFSFNGNANSESEGSGFTTSTDLANLGRKLAISDLFARGQVRQEEEGDRFTELLVSIPADIDSALDTVAAPRIETLEVLSASN